MPKGIPPWNKGKTLSPEIRKKLSEAHMGLPSFWKGKKRPKETAEKISKTMTGRKLPKEHVDKIRAYHQRADSFSKTPEGREISRRGAKSRVYKPFTAEHRARIGLAKTGIVPSLETRLKLSAAHKGSKHYNWKGGITKENMVIRRSIEMRLWREAVFKRDNWTCVFCQARGVELNADHIKQFAFYPELRFDINNGRTLCVPCHLKVYRRKLPKNAA